MDSGPDDDSEAYVENLRSACLEARHTMDKQVARIQGEDDKAVKLLRVNILTLGVLASGLSITVQADRIPVAGFFNLHIGAGILLMLVSSVIASMAYTSSNVEAGIDPTAVQKTGRLSRVAFLEELSESYGVWIQRNTVVHRFNAYALTWAIAFAISGIIYFVGGFSVGLLEIRGSRLSIVVFVAELLSGVVIVGLLFNSDEIFNRVMYGNDSY